MVLKREDLVREIEVSKYFNPPEGSSDDDASPLDYDSQRPTLKKPAYKGNVPTSSDHTLTALAQLCAIRLNAARAMISVIDSRTQYFIAEATKTLNLKDTTKADSITDGLWLGCTSAPKEGRLCERTIELRPLPDAYACYTVTDLSKDPRFKDLPFVSGPPFFRFYAGVPLTTTSGVNIGSLFVIDENVRPALSSEEVEIMGSIADIVMKHVGLAYEAEMKQKLITMKDGINAFQSGKDSILDGDLGPPNGETEESEFESEVPAGSKKGNARMIGKDIRQIIDLKHPQNKTSALQDSPDTDTSSPLATSSLSPDPSSSKGAPSDLQPKRPTFARAANLIRQALRLGRSGGVCIVDASVGFTPYVPGEVMSEDEVSEAGMAHSKMGPNELQSSVVSEKDHNVGGSNSDYLDNEKRAAVLAYSTAENNFGTGSNLHGIESFRPVPEELVQHLLKHYPRGKLWTFTNEFDLLSSNDEEPCLKPVIVPDGKPMSSSSRRRHEVQRLRTFFPSARQLLYSPSWDPVTARWHNACFCFTSKSQPVMSKDTELGLLRTFGSCVMAENARLESVNSDTQKTDFIGSISHELRSPLHGVLASAEFLAETPSDPFQSSLISTVSSCGRTLLDTINHILDFSKINKFEKSWVNARNNRAQRSILAVNNRSRQASLNTVEAPPLMNIYCAADIASVLEEVLEGVYAGQVFQDIGSTDISYKTLGGNQKSSVSGLPMTRRSSQPTLEPVAKEVEVVLEIAQEDYNFTTQIGAIRRIIMNVFGNALKYTNKGLIIIKLSLGDIEGVDENERLLTISIKDTGKGIASKYLRENIYRPFSQEDALATGVGLGLSIVKSITTMLNGSIDIHSQVGVGTQVDIHIPLLRLPGIGSSTSTPSTVTSTDPSVTGNPISTLLGEHPDKLVCLFGFAFASSPQDQERYRVLEMYMRRWFQYQIAAANISESDVIVVDESYLNRLYQEIDICCPVIVLCGASPSRLLEIGLTRKKLIMEIISKPFGPYKLSRALRACFNRATSSISPASTVVPSESSVASEMSTLTPRTKQPESITIDEEQGPMQLTKIGRTTARDTKNANMAINSPRAFSGTDNTSESTPTNLSFPLGAPDVSAGDRFRVQLLARPRLDKRVTEPVFDHTASLPSRDSDVPFEPYTASDAKKSKPALISPASAESTSSLVGQSQAGALESISKLAIDEKPRSPCVLLVEDNKINLRLLQTFMRKRKYQDVDSAENGQLAVKAFTAKSPKYDVIFMDISMPIMNGFEATRAIRENEETQLRFAQEGGQKARPALIIALTGLASEKDQAEAFACGVDLFMTKPVSFKEVGQLLDNWEKNEQAELDKAEATHDLELPANASMAQRLMKKGEGLSSESNFALGI